MRIRTQSADSLGKRICQLATGDDCEGVFFDDEFYPLKTLSGSDIAAGRSVVVTLSDPISVSSDNRTVALVWDDSKLLTVGQQDEGTTREYPIGTVQGSTLTVWCDKKIPSDIQSLSQRDAREKVDQSEKSPFESIGEAAAKAEKRAFQLYLGVGVIAVVLIFAAAYALPKMKIPLKIGA